MDAEQKRFRMLSVSLALLVAAIGWIVLYIQEIRELDRGYNDKLHQLIEKRFERIDERLQRLEDKVNNNKNP